MMNICTVFRLGNVVAHLLKSLQVLEGLLTLCVCFRIDITELTGFSHKQQTTPRPSRAKTLLSNIVSHTGSISQVTASPMVHGTAVLIIRKSIYITNKAPYERHES